MSRRLPPGRQRQQQARAAGLRPRARWWALCAGATAALWGFEGAQVQGPALLSTWLEAGFAEGPSLPDLPVVHAPTQALALGLLLCLVPTILRLLPGRRPTRTTLGVDPGPIDTIPPYLALLSCALALALMLAATRGLPASAARSVDAGMSGLLSLWSGWARHGLLALIGITATLGAIEWLVSARRLWQGLHLTPEQARAQARSQTRAQGRKR